MNDTEKPFACSIKDCDMTFTNEDHLNWHQKKHDMMLNLGLANKQSDLADQTPTPTRFIRNCEEVGLFQDLQNVNPFDEFFKKAVDASKAGVTLEVQQNNSEDTLHTPHILPHIEESQKALNTLAEDGNSHSNDFLQNMIPLTTNACELHVTKIVEPPLIVISDDDVEKHQREERKSVKLKIKQILQKKCKEKTTPTPATPLIALVPINSSLCPPKETNSNSKPKSPAITNKSNKNKKPPNPKSEAIHKEMNRVAQNRCRKRQREAQLQMREELQRLRIENEKLRVENKFLKGQIRSRTGTDALNAHINGANVLSPVLIPIAIQQKTDEVKGSSKKLKRIFPKITATPKNACYQLYC